MKFRSLSAVATEPLGFASHFICDMDSTSVLTILSVKYYVYRVFKKELNNFESVYRFIQRTYAESCTVTL
jgi:hypothetical protein